MRFVIFTLSAVVNTGSPISLIQSEFISNNLNIIKHVVNNSFCSINGVNLNKLGIFEMKLTMNSHVKYFKIHVISNNTMNTNIISGTGFLNKEGFKIEFKNNTVNNVKLDNDGSSKK